MPNDMLIDSVVVALAEFSEAHVIKECKYQDRESIKARYDAIETDLKAAIADMTDDKGKPRFSNDDRRKAELNRRLIADYAELVADLDKAKDDYQGAANACERAEEALKTARALLAYQTSENELEAARLQASTAVTYATDGHISIAPERIGLKSLPKKPRSSYDQFTGPDGDDLPF